MWLLACAAPLEGIDPRDLPWYDPHSPTRFTELGQAGYSHVPGDWSLLVAPGVGPELLADYDAELISASGSAPLLHVRSSPAEAGRMAADRRIRRVLPDPVVSLRDFELPRRPGKKDVCADGSAQVTPDGVEAMGRPRRGGTGAGVLVAVLDTGVQQDHPDLAVAGVSDVTGTTGGEDDNGHGTHVAGTLAALDDGIGVVGVAPDVDLWAIKALDALGYSDYVTMARGVDEALGLGAQVLNMSVGGPVDSDALHEQISAAHEAGLIIVAAAGNEGWPVEYSFPGAYDGEVITVSAWDESIEDWAWFSNYGDAVDVGADGVAVCSTYTGSSWATSDGTSMASPAVAGAVAVALELDPTGDFDSILADLLHSTDPVADSSRHAEDLAVLQGL